MILDMRISHVYRRVEWTWFLLNITQLGKVDNVYKIEKRYRFIVLKLKWKCFCGWYALLFQMLQVCIIGIPFFTLIHKRGFLNNCVTIREIWKQFYDSIACKAVCARLNEYFESLHLMLWDQSFNNMYNLELYWQ
jgi:hypothetical protein